MQPLCCDNFSNSRVITHCLLIVSGDKYGVKEPKN